MAQTSVGTLGSSFRVNVDGAGRMGAPGVAWQLEWWIGAEDRWRVPATEPTIRQRLVEGVPVVETALHVPGGDIVHRAYGVRVGQADVVAFEIANRTPVPVAVAVAVLPGPGPLHRIDVADAGSVPGTGFAVLVDGCPAVVLPGRPRFSATGCRGGDVFRAVAAGEATEDVKSVQCPEGRAGAAYLLPLAHGAVLRAAAIGAGRVRDRPFAPRLRRRGRRVQRHFAAPPLAALPPSDAAVRAWQAQLDRGARLELPPGRLSEALAASRAHLVLAAGLEAAVPPVVATALARFGIEPEASRVQPARRSRRAPAVTRASSVSGGDRLAELLDGASATWTWPGNESGGVSAELCLLVLDMLVSDRDGLALCPSLPPAWFGHNLEVHDVPTTAGLLSFAVRWHGARAALLWDVRDLRGSNPSLRITAPALDPGWSSRAPSGEALLGPVAEPVGGPL